VLAGYRGICVEAAAAAAAATTLMGISIWRASLGMLHMCTEGSQASAPAIDAAGEAKRVSETPALRYDMLCAAHQRFQNRWTGLMSCVSEHTTEPFVC